jgi:hypothetical protein
MQSCRIKEDERTKRDLGIRDVEDCKLDYYDIRVVSYIINVYLQQ